MEAWGKYRPSSAHNSPRASSPRHNKKSDTPKRINRNDIQAIFNKDFIDWLISEIKTKKYSQVQQEKMKDNKRKQKEKQAA